MTRRKLWSERVKEMLKAQEHKTMLKAIYGMSGKKVVSYKWVITNKISGIQVYYRKSAKVLNCWKQVLIVEKDNTTTYYSKKHYKIELCA